MKWFLLGWILEALHSVAGPSPLLPGWGWCLGFSFRLDLSVSRWVDHTRRVGEGPGEGTTAEQVVAGGIGVPFPVDR